MTSARMLALVPLCVAVVGAGWASMSGEVPNWVVGGTRPTHRKSLADLGGRIALSSGDLVLFEGDSNTAGTNVGGSDHAFPELLRLVSGQTIRIANRARGGESVLTWTPRHTGGARLVILMFGSNDAAPRRMLGCRAPVPPLVFRGKLVEVIKRYRGEGAEVLLLAPPPAGAKAMDERIDPYRVAARQAAEISGAKFRDPADAFATSLSEPLLQYDALHLTKVGHIALTKWLVAHAILITK